MQETIWVNESRAGPLALTRADRETSPARSWAARAATHEGSATAKPRAARRLDKLPIGAGTTEEALSGPAARRTGGWSVAPMASVRREMAGRRPRLADGRQAVDGRRQRSPAAISERA
jgi:hypothetical protein